jgi:hypothetical protein
MINFSDGYIDVKEDGACTYFGATANSILCYLIRSKQDLILVNGKITVRNK